MSSIVHNAECRAKKYPAPVKANDAILTDLEMILCSLFKISSSSVLFIKSLCSKMLDCFTQFLIWAIWSALVLVSRTVDRSLKICLFLLQVLFTWRERTCFCSHWKQWKSEQFSWNRLSAVKMISCDARAAFWKPAGTRATQMKLRIVILLKKRRRDSMIALWSASWTVKVGNICKLSCHS